MYRQFTKTIIAIMTPFFSADTPEKARYLLRKEMKLSNDVRKILF